MKKSLIITILIFIFSICLNVNAATYAKEGEENYNTFKNAYESGIKTVEVKSSATVTIYGFSECNSNGCTVTYMNNSSYTYQDVLKNMVKCTNGEKYINYQYSGSGGDGFKKDNKENYTGKVYWTEDYYVTCVNTSSGSNVVEITNTGTGSTGNTGTGSGNTAGTGTTGGYQSSTTTQNEKQGVGTYYVVLGIIGIITYIAMVVIKKQNLFKKV